MENTINRTLVELKPNDKQGDVYRIEPINRTLVELKLVYPRYYPSTPASINRTLVELKRPSMSSQPHHSGAINRTLVELKLVLSLVALLADALYQSYLSGIKTQPIIDPEELYSGLSIVP